MDDDLILVRIYEDSVKSLSYSGYYSTSICIAELIRNCCVNLGIDPDTVDGFTKNIKVMNITKEVIRYNPYALIGKLINESGSIELIFERQ